MTFSTFPIKAADGVALKVESFAPPGDGPVALLLHGIVSHAGWYRWVGEELSKQGISMYLVDRRGAGGSEGLRGHMRSWKVLVEDVLRVIEEIHKRHPGRPVQALGVSLGAAIALATSILHPKVFESHVLLSAGIASAVRLPLYRQLRLLLRSYLRPTHLYDLPFTMKQLTHLPVWQEKYEKDPLRSRQMTSRFLVETFKMQRFVRAGMARLRSPILSLLAEKDELIDNRGVIAALSRAQSTNVRIEIFRNATHNLFLSLPRLALLERIGSWLCRKHAGLGNGLEVETIEELPAGSPEPEPSPQA